MNFQLKKQLLLLVVILNIWFFLPEGVAQTPRQSSSLKNDTLIISKTDSTIIYLPFHRSLSPGKEIKKKESATIKFLQEKAEKSKLNKRLAELIISTSDTTPSPKKTSENYLDYPQHKGKVINKITIKRLDPFGTSLNDTSQHAKSWLARTGNTLRTPTAKYIIRNHLSFEQGDLIDPLNLIDSERILRNLNFIQDALVVVTPSSPDSTQTDVLVLVQDVYPHALSLNIKSNRIETGVYSKNFLGQAISFSHKFIINPGESPNPGIKDKINLVNIGKSFISLKMEYENSYFNHYLMGEAYKDFILPETKYAGSILLHRSIDTQSLIYANQITWTTPLNYMLQNLWLGRSFLIATDGYFNRTNLYFFGETIHTYFYDSNPELQNHPFTIANRFFFGGIAFSKRNYYKNNLIYAYGKTEDVPYGFLSSLIVGYNRNRIFSRFYSGGNFSFGKALIPGKGYIYLGLQAGTFIGHTPPRQADVRFNTSYISNLGRFLSLKSRVFVDIDYQKGFDRLEDEYITIDESSGGLTGWLKSYAKGKEKLILKTENVLFSNHTFWGFRMAPYSFINAAFIGDGKRNLLTQKFYMSIGAGIRLRSDQLVFNTIQLRLAYFPIVPAKINIWDIDISSGTDRKFHDFAPQKPSQQIFK